MYRIALFTGTRADYGLLVPTAKKLQALENVKVGFIAAGNHFSKQFGETYQNIIEDGFEIWCEVKFSDDIVQSVALQAAETIRIIDQNGILDSLNALVILGDRFEALGAAQAAFYSRVPIVHLHAGERTDGAQDDFIRHSISQLASVLVSATDRYRLRCIQLGVSEDRVLNLGSPGQDNIADVPVIETDVLLNELGLENGPFALLTVHSETQHPENTKDILPAIEAALAEFPSLNVLATYPNMDEGHEIIIEQLIDMQKRLKDRMIIVKNLGLKRYIQAARTAVVVIGNSSSGLIEIPSLKTATIDIGTRQAGREKAKSVLQVPINSIEIEQAIRTVLDPSFSMDDSVFDNPYGDPGFSDRFTSWIVNAMKDRKFFATPRTFFDFPENLLNKVITHE